MPATSPRRAAGLSLLALVAAFVVIRLVLAAETPIAEDLVHPHDLRAAAGLRIGVSFCLGVLMFAAAWAILRVQGLDLGATGWTRPARWPGWVAGLGVAGLFLALAGTGPLLRGAPWLSDWSTFRIAGALTAALIGGLSEETVYRGFVISRARDLGLPAVAQVLLSGLLFGLAHVGWGGLSGSFDPRAATAAMVSTGVLGVLFACVYLLAGRSLWPSAAAHALINLAIEPWLMLSAISGTLAHR